MVSADRRGPRATTLHQGQHPRVCERAPSGLGRARASARRHVGL